jgi:4-diphosphocytidyl-2C-methyl-D-erythritol kinase
LKEGGAVAASMSGSGSAVFGLFRTRPAAARLLAPLARGGAKTVLTRTLTRDEYERRSRVVAKRA